MSTSELIEFRLDQFFEAMVPLYAITFGLGPALIGYVCARWTPVFVRAIPLFLILLTGCLWVRWSGHGFEIYVLSNVLYCVFCVAGLLRRIKNTEVRFWSLKHFDWIIAAGATVLMMLVYRKAAA